MISRLPFTIYADDDLKVASSSLGGVYGEVDWLAPSTGADVSYFHAGSVVSLHNEGGALYMEPGHLDLHLVVTNNLRRVLDLILTFLVAPDTAGDDFSERRENLHLRVPHVSLAGYDKTCHLPYRDFLQSLAGQIYLGRIQDQAFEGAAGNILPVELQLDNVRLGFLGVE